MHLDLRPLSVGELFDRAFALYRRNLWLFVGITALPAVFALGMTVTMQVMQRLSRTAFIVDQENPEMTSAAILGVLGLMGGIFVFFIVYWIVYMIALGATTYAVSELYVGRATTIKQSYARMRGRIGALLVLLLLVAIRLVFLWIVGGVVLMIGAVVAALVHPVLSGVLMVFGILALVLAAGWMTLRYGMSVSALVVEGLSPNDAIKRSISLTKGRLGRVFLLVLCSMMVTYAGMLIFQGPFLIGSVVAGPDSSLGFVLDIVGAVTGTVGATFTSPFMIIGLALMYYDARIREEGFDLELTLQALDARTVAVRA